LCNENNFFSSIDIFNLKFENLLSARGWIFVFLCAGLACSQSPEGTRAGECGDGADNDADGSYDCDDEGCAASPLCTQAPLGDDDDSAPNQCVPCNRDFTLRSLADFADIADCESISGELNLAEMDAAVTGIPALPCLTSIGGSLEVQQNPGLRDVDGFSGLRSVGGDLRLFFNTQLEQIDGFSSLESVGGTLAIDLSYALRNVDGFANLTSIGADLHIYDDPLIESFDGFASLQSVGDYFAIALCPLVTHLDGFLAMVSVGGTLAVDQNDALLHIDGLGSLSSLGDTLSVSSNPALQDVDGLLGITTVPGDLRISRDDSLTSISGLANIHSVGGELDVTANAVLCQDHVQAVLGGVVVGGNTLMDGNGGLCP